MGRCGNEVRTYGAASGGVIAGARERPSHDHVACNGAGVQFLDHASGRRIGGSDRQGNVGEKGEGSGRELHDCGMRVNFVGSCEG